VGSDYVMFSNSFLVSPPHAMHLVFRESRHSLCQRGSLHSVFRFHNAPVHSSTHLGRREPTDLDGDFDISQFGNFTPVLSDNPRASGVFHIPRKRVPSCIKHPSYTQSLSGDPGLSQNISILVLGSEDEHRMRRACKLARQTLRFGHSLVRVS
jgi:hypothetical protein